MNCSKCLRQLANRAYVTLLIAVVCAGCDSMPLNGPAPELKATGLVGEGRTNSWLVSEHKFAVPNLLSLPYLDQVDRTAFLESLDGYRDRTYEKGRPVDVTRPEGMDDETYSILRSYADPFRPAAIVLENRTPGPVQRVALSASGSHLLAITDRIEVISLGDRSSVTHEVPVEKLVSAFLSRDAAHLIVVGQDQVVRMDSTTGELIARWQSTLPLVGCDYAPDADRLVVCPLREAITVLDRNVEVLTVVTRISGSPQIAINDRGTHFLRMSKRYALMVEIGDSSFAGPVREGSYGIGEDADEPSPEGLVAFAQQSCLTYDGICFESDTIGGDEDESSFRQFVGQPLWMGAFDHNGRASAVAIFEMRLEDENVYFARDFIPTRQQRGAPVILPSAKPRSADCSSDGSLLALGYDGSVVVIKRQVHPVSGHRTLMRRASYLLQYGKVDQLDLLTKAVIALPKSFDGCTGSELSCEIAQMLSRMTSWYGNVDNPEMAKAAERWWRKDNPCAKLHAVLHRSPLPRSDAYFYGDPSSIESYLRSLEQNWPDSLEYDFARYRMRISRGQFDTAETQALLARMTTQYPLFLRPIANYRLYLNEDRDTRALASALPAKAASIYPTQLRTMISAKILVEEALSISSFRVYNFPEAYRGGLEMLAMDTIVDGMGEQIIRAPLVHTIDESQYALVSQTLVRRALQAGGQEIYSDIHK